MISEEEYKKAKEDREKAKKKIEQCNGTIIQFEKELKEKIIKERGSFTCPRRIEGFGPLCDEIDEDYWMDDNKCSFCGCLNPDKFMERVKNGDQLDPTDKNYKVYLLDPWNKFYFQHLPQDQMKEFIQLLNDKKLNIAGNNFYVLPFFITK